jgi:ureidoglycolate amidohydrolase
VAAAEVIQAVDRAARTSGAEDTVGTVGTLSLEPGAVNSIPRHVRMDIDIRDTDPARRDAVLAQVRAAARQAAEARGVGHADEILNADGPSASDPAVVEAVEDACRESGLASVRMVSRAYHDCVFMARLCPTAMIFVPSAGGVSHRPDEYTSPEEIAQGTRVLAGALRRLAA